jgi:hypothetical protein
LEKKQFCTIQNTMPKEHEWVSKGTKLFFPIKQILGCKISQSG